MYVHHTLYKGIPKFKRERERERMSEKKKQKTDSMKSNNNKVSQLIEEDDEFEEFEEEGT